MGAVTFLWQFLMIFDRAQSYADSTNRKASGRTTNCLQTFRVAARSAGRLEALAEASELFFNQNFFMTKRIFSASGCVLYESP